jgi:predicted permease
MLGKLFRRAQTLSHTSRVDRDITKEIDFHIRMETEKRLRAGLSPEEARRTALRDFGGVQPTREHVRDTRGLTFWDALSQDVRFGLRTLRRSPGYTAAAVLILALGIGANTAIFSVINGVLLKALPFSEGGNLVLLQESAPAAGLASVGVGIPELFDYRKRLQSVKDLVEYHSMSFVLLNQGEPDRVDTGVVSANFFNMLGITPILGRTFVVSDDVIGAEAVLVLSHEYWQQKFGGDPNVIGRVLQMNNRAHTVIGVLPAYPQYPRVNDVYMSTSACPFRSAAEKALPAGGHRSFGALQVFGRLKPGATEAQATAEIATVASSFPKDFPNDYRRAKGLTGRAQYLQDRLVVGARPMLLALGGATMLVLLIACANVANLALARTLQRRRELAVRTALGAGRGRLLRQLVTESVIVSVAGGALGLGLAWLSLDMLVGFVGRFTPRTSQIAIDGGVLAFTLVISVLTGLVFGAAPALASRRNVAQAMREGAAQGGEGAGRNRLRAGLVVAQVAVSFILLVGAALMLESFHRLSSVPLGYETDHVMTAAIFGNFGAGANSLTVKDIIDRSNAIVDRLRSSPGVRAAAATSSVPLSNITPAQLSIRIEGRSDSDSRVLDADGNIASEGYFDTLGIPVLTGRDFRRSDSADAPPVALINASMAKYWDGANPVGTRFLVQNQQPETWLTIVGVVGDFRLYSADRDIEPQFYTPFEQNQGGGGGRLLVRTDGNPHDLVNTIKAVVHGVNKDMPVEELKTIDELRNTQLTPPRLTAALLTVFAAVALVITLAGVTGVIATSVSQRTREFGLRMALGASRGSVLQLVLGQGMVLVVAGLLAGVGGAYAFSRLISGFLFATKPTDAMAYAVVAAIFLVVSLVACLAPARRATTIDPLTALRAD